MHGHGHFGGHPGGHPGFFGGPRVVIGGGYGGYYNPYYPGGYYSAPVYSPNVMVPPFPPAYAPQPAFGLNVRL
jgi:hypothetical protein